ncbi:MAG: hypothetical protein JXR63_07145 [Spirochaetales bacterium]|nr:hypothetical protein [Spirochaetales bacterium]
MKRIIMLAGLFFLFSCEKNVELGSSLNQYQVLDTNQGALINAGTAKQVLQVTVSGISYFVAADESSHIYYIMTYDDNFTTKEKLHLDSSLLDCLKYSRKGIRVERDAYFFVQLDSGWRARIGDSNLSLEEVYKRDKIDYFYKVNPSYSFDMSYQDYKELILLRVPCPQGVSEEKGFIIVKKSIDKKPIETDECK